MKSASVTVPLQPQPLLCDPRLASADPPSVITPGGVPGLPEVAPNDVTGGLAWSSVDHAVSVVDGRGQEMARLELLANFDGDHQSALALFDRAGLSAGLLDHNDHFGMVRPATMGEQTRDE